MTEIKDEYPSEKIILQIEAKVTGDPAYSKGTMHFAFQDCCAKVVLAGKEIGEITGCLGGGFEIKDEESKKTYFISAQSIWEAFSNRIEA